MNERYTTWELQCTIEKSPTVTPSPPPLQDAGGMLVAYVEDNVRRWLLSQPQMRMRSLNEKSYRGGNLYGGTLSADNSAR